MPPTRIHHINFVVHDLDEAMSRFERTLGLEPFEVIEHLHRNARVARSPVGESWLVLVCPNDTESVPGRYLARKGEGFFLLSLGVDDLDAHLDSISAEISPDACRRRPGILDWEVADIGELNGALLQFADDSK